MINSRRLVMRAVCAVLVAQLVACAATKPPSMSRAHLRTGDMDVPDARNIPRPVAHSPYVPRPGEYAKPETYTVVVNDVPVKELLFALARDAKLNVDVHPGIEGRVTLNAVNQTLPQILARISEQTPLVHELKGTNLAISPDLPMLRSYKIDYVNMSRTSSSSVSVATRMATAGGSVASSGSSDTGNSSKTSVESTSTNDFWVTLQSGVEAILGGGTTSGGSASGNVIANPISGVLTVRATQRQHHQVQQFLDQVMTNAQRQVLIEATIVEVELSDDYQSGIDWAIIQQKGGKTYTLASTMTGSNLALPPSFLLGYDRDSPEKTISAAVHLLETFGDAKVLSSPKIIAMNNQTALLKVVDERVYFTTELEITAAQGDVPEQRTYTSELHTVPVGVVMSVTPQVNENGNVTLNIRPTITRITGYVPDPMPRLQGADFDNLIPEIQIREMESLLQVRTGQTVVLGGLMQNKEDKNTSGIPYLSGLPLIGNLFSYRQDTITKTELVIFLRPVLANDELATSTAMDYAKEIAPISRNETSFRK